MAVIAGIPRSRKDKGDLAELKLLADLVARGHKVALPYGEDWDFDLIVMRQGRLERVQAKYLESDGRCIAVKCFSSSNLSSPAADPGGQWPAEGRPAR